MANPYDSAKGDPKGLEDALLGPHAYTYYDKVKSPGAMGMSSDGTIGALTDDVAGLIAYVKLLSTGKSEASSTGGPLGNKYFLQTSAKCFDSSGAQVPRYIYINNIPDGKFPLLSGDSGMNLDLSSFEGLIPGVMEDIMRMNPMNLFQAFVTGSKPSCTEVTLPVGNAGEPGMLPPDCSIAGACETHHLLDVDIKGMNAAWFPGGNKPSVSEGFTTRAAAEMEANKDISEMPSDPIIKLWYGALGLLGLYILMKLFMRK